MNIRTIAGAIAEKFGVEGLESRDGKIEMEIDGAPVMIEETDGDAFIFNGLVGDAPSEGGEAFARILLESNQVMMHSRAVALARDPHSGAYVIVERVPAAAASDFESFCACLGKFADALESWRGTLKDFSPAAAQAAAVSVEKEAETLNALRNGFLRI